MRKITFGSLALQSKFFALFKDDGPEVEMQKVSEGSAKKVEDSNFGPLYAFSANEYVRIADDLPKKVIGRTTRMFEVAMYDDGTADLVGASFRVHPTLRISGDGTLQNPLEIVPK